MNLQQNKTTRTAGYVLLLTVTYVLLIRIRLIFSYSLDLDGAEFAFIHFVQILLDGRPLYQNPGIFPYFAVLYMPVYPYVCFVISHLLGLHAADIHNLYIIGRTLSVIFVILSLGVLNQLLSFFLKALLLRLLCITLFILLLSGHIFTARPDALQLLFFMLFLYFIFQYFYSTLRRLWLLYALLFALLAVFTKQDAVVFIFIVLFTVHLFIRTRQSYTALLAFILLLALALASAYMVFGNFFFTNVVTYNFQVLTEFKKTYNLKAVAFSLGRLLPLIIAVGYLVWSKEKKNRLTAQELFTVAVTMCCLVITHILMFRAGAYLNYTYPAVLLLILSFAILLNSQLQDTKKISKMAYACMALYLVSLFFSNYLIHSYTYNSENENLSKQRYYSLLRFKNDVTAITKNDTLFFPNSKYTILFDNNPVVFGYDMHIDRMIEALTGFRVHSRMPFVATQQYDRLFETGAVQYIISDTTSISQKQIKSYYRHFRFNSQTDGFNIYKYAVME